MRRLLLVLPALALAACGGAEDPPSAQAPQATTSSQRAATQRRAVTRPTGAAARVTTIARGLEVPWDLAFLPSGDALVTERPGRVRLLAGGRRLRAQPVARVTVDAVGEGGLMGIAIDRRFEDNGFVYLFLTRFPDVRLERWRYDEDARRLTRDRVLVDDITAGAVHDSGRIRFGPDGRLYVATGDAGQADLAQDPDSLNGKFLAFDPGPLRGDGPVRPEVVSTGHRNPQGLDWDSSGRLVATEHGPSGGDGPQGFDEVNVIRAGRNYGWPRAFGNDHDGFTAPIRVYEEAIAPSGAAFVRGTSRWRGSYVFATLRGESLRRLRLRAGRVVGEQVLLRGRFGRLRAVVAAPDGSLLVTTSNRDGRGDGSPDRILRIRPPR